MQPNGISLVQRNVLYSSFVAFVIKQITRNTIEIQMPFVGKCWASPKYEGYFEEYFVIPDKEEDMKNILSGTENKAAFRQESSGINTEKSTQSSNLITQF